MKKPSSTVWMIVLAVVVFGALIGGLVYQNNAPSKYDDFAQCLTDKGATMYGAYWCPHCADQEALFGSAFKHINYVECSSPGSTTFDLCPDIESTPTWESADGVRVKGQRTLQELADRFSCDLPQ